MAIASTPARDAWSVLFGSLWPGATYLPSARYARAVSSKRAMVGLAIGALTVGALVAALMAVWPRMDSTLPSGHAPTQALPGRDPSLLAQHVVVGTEAITLELPLPYTKPDGWRLCAQLAEGASVRSGTLLTTGGKLLSLRVRARGSADESLALDALSVQDEPPDLWACFSIQHVPRAAGRHLVPRGAERGAPGRAAQGHLVARSLKLPALTPLLPGRQQLHQVLGCVSWTCAPSRMVTTPLLLVGVRGALDLASRHTDIGCACDQQERARAAGARLTVGAMARVERQWLTLQIVPDLTALAAPRLLRHSILHDAARSIAQSTLPHPPPALS